MVYKKNLITWLSFYNLLQNENKSLRKQKYLKKKYDLMLENER